MEPSDVIYPNGNNCFLIGECVVENELKSENNELHKNAGATVMLALNMKTARSNAQACAICYYDSENDETDEGLEESFAKKPVQPIERYANLSILDGSSNNQQLCTHTFHTVCLYNWIKTEGSTGGFNCPICRSGLYKQRLAGIPDMFERIVQPEFVQHFWHTGLCKEKYYEVDGKKEGLYISYYITGHIEYECTYKKGMKHGVEKHFYDDVSHTLKSSVDFSDDKKHGWSSWFTANGKTIGKAQYNNGQKSGPHIEWYTDSAELRLRSVEHHLNGKRHGLFMKWAYTGKILLYGVYVNDEKNGRFCAWYEENYSLKIKEYYINGIKHGKSTEYFAKVRSPKTKSQQQQQIIPKETGNYDHGAKNGIWKTYWSNGQLKTECEYNTAGQIDGVLREWDRFGRIWKVFRYDCDELDGVSEIYDKSLPPHIPLEIATYRHGQLHGLCVIRYKQTGKLKVVKNFNYQSEIFSRWFSRTGEITAEYRNGQTVNVYNSVAASCKISNLKTKTKPVNNNNETIKIKNIKQPNIATTKARFI